MNLPICLKSCHIYRVSHHVSNMNCLLQVVGGDLIMSNPKRIERAIQENSCNALLLKVPTDICWYSASFFETNFCPWSAPHWSSCTSRPLSLYPEREMVIIQEREVPGSDCWLIKGKYYSSLHGIGTTSKKKGAYDEDFPLKKSKSNNICGKYVNLMHKRKKSILYKRAFLRYILALKMDKPYHIDCWLKRLNLYFVKGHRLLVIILKAVDLL